jgi:hypothetical protein
VDVHTADGARAAAQDALHALLHTCCALKPRHALSLRADKAFSAPHALPSAVRRGEGHGDVLHTADDLEMYHPPHSGGRG